MRTIDQCERPRAEGPIEHDVVSQGDKGNRNNFNTIGCSLDARGAIHDLASLLEKG